MTISSIKTVEQTLVNATATNTNNSNTSSNSIFTTEIEKTPSTKEDPDVVIRKVKGHDGKKYNAEVSSNIKNINGEDWTVEVATYIDKEDNKVIDTTERRSYTKDYDGEDVKFDLTHKVSVIKKQTENTTITITTDEVDTKYHNKKRVETLEIKKEGSKTWTTGNVKTSYETHKKICQMPRGFNQDVILPLQTD